MRMVGAVGWLLLMASGCGGGGGEGAKQTASQPGIEPGRSVGYVKLGEPLSRTVSSYGQPGRIHTGSSDIGSWVYATWPSKGIIASYSDQDRDGQADPEDACTNIFVVAPSAGRGARPGTGRAQTASGELAQAITDLLADPAFQPYGGRTAAGIGLGSSRSEVWSRLGKPERVTGNVTSDWYSPQGMLLTYDGERRVAVIHIMSPLAYQIEAGYGASPVMIQYSSSTTDAGYLADAVELLGQPTSFRTGSDSVGPWVAAAWASAGLEALFNDSNGDGKVGPAELCFSVIAVAPYAGRDYYGLGIGSTQAAVRARYGQPDRVVSLEEGVSGELYDRIGIAFQYAAGASPAETKVTALNTYRAAGRAAAGRPGRP